MNRETPPAEVPETPPADESAQPAGPEGVPAVGEVLAGKYRVERVLGVGGMGAVVSAMHLQLGERVALKFLLPSMANAETLERFGREARAAARIKSEHIARVTDVGTLETGSPYMVMEFLEGSDLAEVIRGPGQIPVRDAVEYIIQACDAVAEAHALGIVHRDLKPANLFLSRRPGAPPRVKVLDFGISKLVSAEPQTPMQQRAMTHTRAWLGSPLYMAPEQMKSARDVDARTDIWSLGVILFELLTKTVPFNGSNLPELCGEILHGEPANVEERRPDVPPEIAEVLRTCFEKDPALRFQNVAELVLALVEFAPRRARSVAERAVSVLEEAGLLRASALPRPPLDGTLSEPMMSPLYDSNAPVPRSVSYTNEVQLPRPPRAPSFPPSPPSTRADLEVAEAATMMARPASVANLGADTASGGGLGKTIAAVVVTLLVSLGAVYFALVYKPWQRGADAAQPTASVEAASTGAPTETATATAAAAPSVAPDRGATPPPAETVAPVPSVAPAATATPAPHASATAAASARAGKGAAATPTATAAAHAPAAPPTPEPQAPAAPPKANSDLTTEQCHQTLPDGTRKVIPCPP